jgi:hypothetical protein
MANGPESAGEFTFLIYRNVSLGVTSFPADGHQTELSPVQNAGRKVWRCQACRLEVEQSPRNAGNCGIQLKLGVYLSTKLLTPVSPNDLTKDLVIVKFDSAGMELQ